jgi:tetratricopeptide (TPR) repeat protein
MKTVHKMKDNYISLIRAIIILLMGGVIAGCMTPLINAAGEGDSKEVERLLSNGADMEDGMAGNTPLMFAVGRGHFNVVKLLIEKGADVNAKNSQGRTPLLFAVLDAVAPAANTAEQESRKLVPELGNKDEVRRVNIAKLLIDNGADIDAAMAGLDSFNFVDVTASRNLLKKLAKEHETAKQAKIAAAIADKQAKIAAETAAEEAAYEEAFTRAAANYRAASEKPTLSEDVRKFKVQAEFAVSKKKFGNAVALYKEALDAAPWWPEGRFNRALILGELSRYHEAILEMKRYLKLVPDAPNARAAQDKIYQWEGALK